MEDVRSLLKYYSSSFSLDDLTSRLAGDLLEHLYPLMKENLVSFLYAHLGLFSELTSLCALRCSHCVEIAGLRNNRREAYSRLWSLIDAICERKPTHTVILNS